MPEYAVDASDRSVATGLEQNNETVFARTAHHVSADWLSQFEAMVLCPLVVRAVLMCARRVQESTSGEHGAASGASVGAGLTVPDGAGPAL